MRRVAIAALTVVAVLAVGGVAYATNVYELTSSKTTPAGVGTPSKPVPKGVAFDYTVKDTGGPRGAPVEKYKIAFQGLSTKWQSKFPQCKFSQTSPDAPLATIMSKCKKAKVGQGRVENLVTSDATAGDPNNVLFYCNLQLTLFNIPGGLSIRLDGDNTTQPTSQDGPIGCIVPTHRAIQAKYVTKKIGGVPGSSLEFSVPDDLRHNSGLTITVARTQSSLARTVTKAKIGGVSRSVGFYSAVGCGKKRIVRVTFVDEHGVSSNEQSSARC